MKTVTYIIPIHKFNDEIKPYVERAFKSLIGLKGAEKAEVFLVGDVEVITEAKSFFEGLDAENQQIVTLVPTKEQDLFEKINFAVSKCHTPYFSILEFDDEFYPYWDTVAQRYTDNEYSIIMPMVEIVTTKDEIAGLANELAWDAAFAGDKQLGFVGQEDLFVFKDFLASGAYIKTDDFIKLGKLKPELQIVAWYEYLLNTATNDRKIFVAPRIGYRHTLLREDSYTSIFANEHTVEEGAALIDKVLKQYKTPEVAGVTEG